MLRLIQGAIEVDVLSQRGMRVVFESKDPFQWAPRFPLATMPNGMSVTEWVRVHGIEYVHEQEES